MKGKKNGILQFITKSTIIAVIILSTVITLTGLIFAIYIEKNIEKTIDENMFFPVGPGASTKIYYYDFYFITLRVSSAASVGLYSIII